MKKPSYQSQFVALITKVSNVILANILWILFCLPIVTIGASTVALSRVAMNVVRKEDSSVKAFLRAFRENFKQATLIWLLFLLFGGLIGLNIYLVLQWQTRVQQLLLAILIMAAVVYGMVLIYLFPLIAQFRNSGANQIVIAFALSVRHFKYTLPMLIVHAFPLVMLLFLPDIFIKAGALWMSFGFGLIALFDAKLLVTIFDRLIAKSKGENTAKSE